MGNNDKSYRSDFWASKSSYFFFNIIFHAIAVISELIGTTAVAVGSILSELAQFKKKKIEFSI